MRKTVNQQDMNTRPDSNIMLTYQQFENLSQYLGGPTADTKSTQ